MSRFKKNIIEVDFVILISILKRNFFLIIFFGLLFAAIGYFTQNQNNKITEAQITFSIFPNDNLSNISFYNIYENLKRINALESEMRYVNFIDSVNYYKRLKKSNRQDNSSVQLILPSSTHAISVNPILEDFYFFNGNRLLSLIVFNMNDRFFERVVFDSYNEFIINEFNNNEDEINKYILKSVPNINGTFKDGAIDILIYFTFTPDRFIIENYNYQVYKNIKNILLNEIKAAIQTVYTNFDENRESLLGDIMFKKSVLKEYEFDEQPLYDHNSKAKYSELINKTGLFEDKLEFFYHSNKLKTLINHYELKRDKVSSQNALLFFPIIGIIIGIFVSIIFYGFSSREEYKLK